MKYNKKSKPVVLISIVLLAAVISGAMLLGACSSQANQDVIDGDELDSGGNMPKDIFIKFESNNGFPGQYKDEFANYIAELFTEKYSPYYQIKGFEFTNVEHILTDTNLEITFFLKMINQNYYKDPDTVEYIKEAKENNSKHYKQLYDEYNQPKESNYDMKFTAKLNDGDIDAGSIQIFTNVHPKGVEYEPIGEDFFPGD